MSEIPKIFIGSSSETLATALAVKEVLSEHADVTVWRDAFLPGQMLLLNIVGLVSKFDFGVFLFSPDDMIKIRTERTWAVRDNVLFEAGVFMGGLGVERTFLLVVGHVRTPSDLAGLLFTNIPTLSNLNSKSARRRLSDALDPVARSIKSLLTPPRNSYDEVLALALELDQRELEISKQTYVLGDLVRKAARARRKPWYLLTDPSEFFEHLGKTLSNAVVDEVYWWLVVVGVIRFRGIDAFTSDEGWDWKDSVEFVQISERGVRLLNQMQTK